MGMNAQCANLGSDIKKSAIMIRQDASNDYERIL